MRASRQAFNLDLQHQVYDKPQASVATYDRGSIIRVVPSDDPAGPILNRRQSSGQVPHFSTSDAVVAGNQDQARSNDQAP